MNTSKLHKALNEGELDDFISDLPKQKINQLIDLLKWEIINYKEFSRNYSKEKYEEYSVPYIEKREKLKGYLEKAIVEAKGESHGFQP